jgi:hypothetical protein
MKRASLLLLLAACVDPGLNLVAPKLVVHVDAEERMSVDFGEVVVTNRATRTLILENAGDALGILSKRVQATVEDFKKFIESRGVETGGWRGEVR